MTFDIDDRPYVYKKIPVRGAGYRKIKVTNVYGKKYSEKKTNVKVEFTNHKGNKEFVFAFLTQNIVTLHPAVYFETACDYFLWLEDPKRKQMLAFNYIITKPQYLHELNEIQNKYPERWL